MYSWKPIKAQNEPVIFAGGGAARSALFSYGATKPSAGASPMKRQAASIGMARRVGNDEGVA